MLINADSKFLGPHPVDRIHKENQESGARPLLTCKATLPENQGTEIREGSKETGRKACKNGPIHPPMGICAMTTACTYEHFGIQYMLVSKPMKERSGKTGIKWIRVTFGVARLEEKKGKEDGEEGPSSYKTVLFVHLQKHTHTPPSTCCVSEEERQYSRFNGPAFPFKQVILLPRPFLGGLGT